MLGCEQVGSLGFPLFRRRGRRGVSPEAASAALGARSCACSPVMGSLQVRVPVVASLPGRKSSPSSLGNSGSTSCLVESRDAGLWLHRASCASACGAVGVWLGLKGWIMAPAPQPGGEVRLPPGAPMLGRHIPAWNPSPRAPCASPAQPALAPWLSLRLATPSSDWTPFPVSLGIHGFFPPRETLAEGVLPWGEGLPMGSKEPSHQLTSGSSLAPSLRSSWEQQAGGAGTHLRLRRLSKCCFEQRPGDLLSTSGPPGRWAPVQPAAFAR